MIGADSYPVKCPSGWRETEARKTAPEESYAERIIRKRAEQFDKMLDHVRDDFEPVLRELGVIGREVVIDRQPARSSDRFEYRV